jgi:hypothetical protein
MDFKKMTSILYILISSCTTKHSKEEVDPPTQREDLKILLPSAELEQLLSKEFIIKLMVDGMLLSHFNGKRRYPILILSHFMWENIKISEFVLKIIVDEVNVCSIGKIKPLMDAVTLLLHIKDDLIKDRIKIFMQSITEMLQEKKDNKGQIQECTEIIQCLQNIMNRAPKSYMTNWLNNNEQKWTWIRKW